MLIGIPKEIKDHEYRVGATPSMVRAFTAKGHNVRVQKNAGTKIGFLDAEYAAAGAEIVESAKEVYQSEMVIKVKEPLRPEWELLHKGQILYCYLHLAPEKELTQALLDKGVVGVAYETVTDSFGRLPLLVPMSEIAGRLSVQIGATYLQMANGGKGVLLGGVPGVLPGKVVIIGGGVVGTQAATMAVGLGADVTIMDNNLNRLRELNEIFGARLKTRFATPQTIEQLVKEADLLVGAVLVPGKLAPQLVSREMVSKMQKGSVIVDVAIDQGGCIATSKVTTHSNPTYEVDGVVHYGVANMPGACARTATDALTNATWNYGMMLAQHGWKEAMAKDHHLKMGLNVAEGKVTNKAVANDLGYTYVDPDTLLK